MNGIAGSIRQVIDEECNHLIVVEVCELGKEVHGIVCT